jgi:hypothetical protein
LTLQELRHSHATKYRDAQIGLPRGKLSATWLYSAKLEHF